MDRLEARARARELLDQVYMTAAEPDGNDPDRLQLAQLARDARSAGAPLGDHGQGPWRSDRCRTAHTGAPGGSDEAGALTCVMRGEFELPLPQSDAADVAALLNWAEVPEPGAQT